MTQLKKSKKWVTQKNGYLESLEYLQGRMNGSICSIRTPWPKFNDALTDGFEWNTITVIGGRPASGKTLIAEQIIREAFPLNPTEKFRVLQFQLEMLSRTSAIREYSSVLGRSYKYLCSAEVEKLTKEDLKKCHEHAKKRVQYPIDIVEKAPTIEQFKDIVHEYMSEHTAEDGEYTKVIMTIDHSLLFKLAPTERTRNDMLNNLGEALTHLGYSKNKGTKKIVGKTHNTPVFFTLDLIADRTNAEKYEYYRGRLEHQTGSSAFT